MNNSLGKEEEFSLMQELQKYLIHWKWFVISVFITLLFASIYLIRSNSVYQSIITVLIKDKTEGRGLSELAVFADLGVAGGNTDIDDEIDIIKSKTLLTTLTKELNLNVIQETKKGLKTIDAYSYTPFKIKFEWNKNIRKDDLFSINEIFLELKSDQSFILNDIENDIVKEYNYGSVISFEQGNLVIEKSNQFLQNKKAKEPIESVSLSILPIDSYVSILQREISAEKKGKRSSIIDISTKTTNKYKSRDVLNTLIKYYNQQAIDDKNLLSKNTANFISERLRLISRELDSIEIIKKIFKKGNKLTDMKAEAEVFIDEVSDSKKRILNIETQLDLTNSMISYLKDSNRKSDILPPNIGLNDGGVNNSIDQYNKLVLERDRLLTNSTELNPLVIDLTSDIEAQKINLLEALQNQRNNFLITKKDYQKEQSKIDYKIASIPAIEKDFRVIERQQQIKESLYLFLLKKREETSISMSVTEPVAKVIDKAYSLQRPIAPNKKIILLAALMLGLLIPFSIIYINDLMDTKIHSKSDVELIAGGIPVLSELPRIKRNNKDVIGRNDRTPLGESFRILTTNLNYFSKGKHIDGKALNIFVTSTIKGEGKTFVSYNLCLSLAEAGNKILIIGADIRNPQLHRFEQPEEKKAKGLAEYLYDDSVQVDEVITNINHNETNVDVVFSGRIPPNPTELLNNGRLQELVESVSADYDIIIVDTAPTMLVTDTLLISKIADITLYVTRAGFTDTRLLQYPKQLKEENKLKGLAFVINDVKENNLGYGTKYGYGYGEEVNDKWYQRIFKKS